MKILILGGTGVMGLHLVKYLSDNGISSFVTTRSDKKSSDKIKYIKGNAKNIDFLKILLKTRWDVIVDFMVYNTESFKERILLLLNATEQYIYLSSARVYADSKSLITELSSRLLDVSKDDDFLKTDEYSLAKAREEDILKKTQLGNWTIIRPYITYGKNRLQLGVLEKENWLYRALQGRTIVFSSDIASKITTLTYGCDVAIAIAKLIGNKKSLTETYHVVTNQNFKWEYILSVYMEELEKKLGSVPKVLILDKSPNLKFPFMQYQVKYDRLFNRRFDNSKIKNDADIVFSDVEANLRISIREFLKNPDFLPINWKIEALSDKAAKEKTSLKEIKSIKQKIIYMKYRYLNF